MNRWYRAYEGTVTDAKIAEVALVAGCSRSVAIAAWHAILESAATCNSGGCFDTTPRRVAAILCEPLAAIEAVFAEFVALGMISDGCIAAWKRRQYESDSSTERSRAYRERRRNGDATLQQRDATPPETETETETETEETTSVVSSAKPRKRGCRLPDDWLPSPLPADCQPHDAGMIERELSRFRDYWIAKPGAQGVKLDWDATWRNWMRRAMEQGNGNGRLATPASGQHRPSASLDWIERNIGGWGRTDETDAGSQGLHSRAGLALPGRT